MARLARGAGLASALATGITLGGKKAPLWADHYAEKLTPKTTDVAWWTSTDPLSGFLTYAFLLAIALTFVGVYVLFERLLGRFRIVRWVLPVAAVVAAHYCLSWSDVVREAGPTALVSGALLLWPHVGGSYAKPPTPSRVLAIWVLAMATLSLGWGAWLATSYESRGQGIGAAIVAMTFGAWRIRVALGADEREATWEALAATPLLALPLVGLLRAPSPLLIAAAVAVAAAVRFVLRRRSGPASVPDWLAGTLAPASIASIFVIPLKMRDLPTVSHKDHEAQHFGWINSALHGKLLMAEAGTMYGPVREYLLTGWCLLFGATIQQIRIGFIVLNLIGLGIALHVGWKLVHKSVWLILWCACLVVAYSPTWTLLDYRNEVSLGWADLARPGWAVLAVAGAVTAVAEAPSELPGNRRFYLRLAGWGVGALLSTLYSQEHGLCAFGAATLAVLAHRWWAVRATFVRRLLEVFRTAGAYIGGFAGGLLVWLLAYAAKGCAGLFLHTIWEMTRLEASGAWGFTPFPLRVASFDNAALLTDVPGVGGGYAWEFGAGPAVFLLTGAALLGRAARGKWDARATLMLGLLLYGATSFRVAMHRADVYHLLSGTLAPALLLAALVADLARARLRVRAVAVPLGAAAAAVVLWASPRLSFFDRFVGRWSAIARFDEVASSGEPHLHPDLPRAGDVVIPPDIEAAAIYIRENTSPTDPIFCRNGFMVGPEFYFLANRRNPTRFDMLAELATHAMQAEAVRELKRDPPKLVVGSCDCQTGDELPKYLSQWKPVKTFGSITISIRPDDLHD